MRKRRKKHYQLNLEAIRCIKKGGGNQIWGRKSFQMMHKLKDEKEAAQNTMLIPILKRTVDEHRLKSSADILCIH